MKSALLKERAFARGTGACPVSCGVHRRLLGGFAVYTGTLPYGLRGAERVFASFENGTRSRENLWIRLGPVRDLSMGFSPTEDLRMGLGPVEDLTVGLGPTEDLRIGLGPVGDLTVRLGLTEDLRMRLGPVGDQSGDHYFIC
ncbi:hypothetical protein CRG98_013432 [Punica granatum]|uniref:Uncharacterized protein n=1 Tax=Punica granatum TaxID=22663 RepID=A0A2I0KCB2_PUNGR|nr:hypothetical protein CRG98_013432 [Punica granatum]